MSNYIKITSKNLTEIKKALDLKKGKLLLYEPDLAYRLSSRKTERVFMGSAHFHLFGNARIISSQFISASSFNHKESREYTLRQRIPSDDLSWEVAYSFFNSLNLPNNYVFQIYGQVMIGCPLFYERGRSLYIPNGKSLENALEDTLTVFVNEVNKENQTGLGKKEINLILEYAIEDLKTGKILEHNLKAGKAADAVTGLA